MSKCLEGERLGGSPSATSTGEESATTTTSTGSSEGPPPLISPELEDKFTIVVDGDVIVLDDVTKQVYTCFEQYVRCEQEAPNFYNLLCKGVSMVFFVFLVLNNNV